MLFYTRVGCSCAPNQSDSIEESSGSQRAAVCLRQEPRGVLVTFWTSPGTQAMNVGQRVDVLRHPWASLRMYHVAGRVSRLSVWVIEGTLGDSSTQLGGVGIDRARRHDVNHRTASQGGRLTCVAPSTCACPFRSAPAGDRRDCASEV